MKPDRLPDGREDWQLLILHGLTADAAKAEIHAPILLALLAEPILSDPLGRVSIVVLNPAARSVLEMSDWHELEQKTEANCRLRGDEEESVQERVRSIPNEGPAWRQLILEHEATEFVNWQYPEYRYRTDPTTPAEARRCLVETNPDLEFFLCATHLWLTW